jgi:hypothetical protein
MATKVQKRAAKASCGVEKRGYRFINKPLKNPLPLIFRSFYNNLIFLVGNYINM